MVMLFMVLGRCIGASSPDAVSPSPCPLPGGEGDCFFAFCSPRASSSSKMLRFGHSRRGQIMDEMAGPAVSAECSVGGNKQPRARTATPLLLHSSAACHWSCGDRAKI